MRTFRKPALNPKSAELATQRKSLIASKVPSPVAPSESPDPSLFSLEQEAKDFASRVDSGFKTIVERLASVVPSIEVTNPKPKTAVGAPGAQGVPGQPGNNAEIVILTGAGYDSPLAEYLALDPEVQMDGRWYVVPKP